nr:MAG TPA: hypothetical protein [Caudoviricetes sp.]
MVFLFLRTYSREPYVLLNHQLACTCIHYTVYLRPKQAF